MSTTLRVINDITGRTYNLPIRDRDAMIGRLFLAHTKNNTDPAQCVQSCVHISADVITLHYYARRGAEDLALAIWQVMAGQSEMERAATGGLANV